ncbi:unnamed protein product [Paramecium octaurelia]|uniref:Uncharacterized protein n=1 Tax=Paramecium octaurelia TaxID=43137 RepID=A0A8S1X068_PAROT|nr:unnamed protein product [Paramecium octaurelia]
MVFVYEHGVFLSQSPVLFSPQQFTINNRYYFQDQNCNLIFVNTQREFIDQLKEDNEIGLDFYLVNQRFLDIQINQIKGSSQNTLEDILTGQTGPTLSFKALEIIIFIYNKQMEIEVPQQTKKTMNLINYHIFKQNFLNP